MSMYIKGYKKGTLLEEYFLNPHFKPTEKELQELELIFKITLDNSCQTDYNNNLTNTINREV